MKAFKQKGPNDDDDGEGQEKDSTSVVHMIRSRKIEQCSKKKAYTQSQRAVSTHIHRERSLLILLSFVAFFLGKGFSAFLYFGLIYLPNFYLARN